MDMNAMNQCDCCYYFNYSCSRIAVSTPTCAGLYMLVVAVVLVTVCGNLLVIISICSFKDLQTPTNFILLSLAVADLLIGLTIIPIFFILLLESCWYLGLFACKLFYTFASILPCVSVYTVVLIAVDRFIALGSPFLYTSKMTVSVSLWMTCLIWVYSIIYSITVFYFNGNFSIGNGCACFGECIAVFTDIWSYIDLVCVYVVSCSVIIILYSNIFAIAKRHIRLMSKQTLNSNRVTNQSTEAKAATNLGIIVLVFLFCCIPYAVTLFVGLNSIKPSMTNAIISTYTVSLLNSTINPIIYALFYPWFKKCVRNMFTGALFNY